MKSAINTHINMNKGFYSRKYRRFFKSYENMLKFDRKAKYDWLAHNTKRLTSAMATYKGKSYLPDEEYFKKFPEKITQTYGRRKTPEGKIKPYYK